MGPTTTTTAAATSHHILAVRWTRPGQRELRRKKGAGRGEAERGCFAARRRIPGHARAEPACIPVFTTTVVAMHRNLHGSLKEVPVTTSRRRAEGRGQQRTRAGPLSLSIFPFFPHLSSPLPPPPRVPLFRFSHQLASPARACVGMRRRMQQGWADLSIIQAAELNKKGKCIKDFRDGHPPLPLPNPRLWSCGATTREAWRTYCIHDV